MILIVVGRLSREVELLKTRELIEHEEIIYENLVTITESIRKLGYILKPIIVDEKTLTIIDGHHRFNALKMLGAKYIPVVYADYNKDITNIIPGKITIPITLSPEEAVNKIYFLIKSTVRRGPNNIQIKIIDNRTMINTKIRIDLADFYININNILKNTNDLHKNSTDKIEATLILPLINRRNIETIINQEEKLPPKTSYHITPLKKIMKPVKLSKLI